MFNTGNSNLVLSYASTRSIILALKLNGFIEWLNLPFFIAWELAKYKCHVFSPINTSMPFMKVLSIAGFTMQQCRRDRYCKVQTHNVPFWLWRKFVCSVLPSWGGRERQLAKQATMIIPHHNYTFQINSCPETMAVFEVVHYRQLCFNVCLNVSLNHHSPGMVGLLGKSLHLCWSC